MKKAIVTVFTLSMAFLYVFGTNSANAAVGTHDVEKTFDMDVTVSVPGAERLPLGKLTFNATVPNSVKPGDEFYLTNTSYTITHLLNEYERPDEPAIGYFGELAFTVDSENETKSISKIFRNDIITVEIPAGASEYSFTIGDGGVDVGPFIAGQEGNVIIKAKSVDFAQGWEGPDGELIFSPLVWLGVPAEYEDLTVASIQIDGEAPVITLNGEDTMVIKQGDPYVELGATAKDNIDGDVSDDIEISGDVDTSTIGTYKITYTVSDSAGNEAVVERTVNVVEPFGSWYTGEGAPNDELGSNGDSYLDITTGDVYKRDPNKWNKVGNLKGDDGKQGSSILTGSGAPKADAGDVGDLYLDTNTGDVYEKSADGWKKIANLQGPAGPQGPKGSDGLGGGSGSGDDGGKGKSKTSTSSDKNGKGKSAQGGKLPKTATSLPTLILIGTLLVATGGVIFLRRRKAIE